MKLLDTQQIRNADQFTIEQEGIQSVDLMERAAQACNNWIINNLGYQFPFVVLCGPGNNGGDGLAIARLLSLSGISVTVLQLESEKYSKDHQINSERLSKTSVNIGILNTESISKIAPEAVIIDALFGTGFQHKTSTTIDEIILHINRKSNFKVAIDLPSGLQGESTPEQGKHVLKASVTLCFHKPRLAFFFPESAQFVGQWEIIDIGLKEEKSSGFERFLITANDVKSLLQRRPKFSHKGIYGHTLLAGGSLGITGSMILSSKAALRSGTGKVTAYIPKVCVNPIQTAIPEAMCIASTGENYLDGSFNPDGFQSIGFGMGAGKNDETAKVLKSLIQNAKCPLVIDADGLNILAENPTWLAFLPAFTILTPHPGELDRMVGKSENTFERWNKAMQLSMKTNAIVVLKGAHTAVCLPNGSCWFNTSGNPGMATAGSGDVLSGIIAAFCAQGYPPEKAAIIGVFVHGKAGDLAAEQNGMTGLIATDIINHLGKVWIELGS
jgi:NAD(P)H-hydrate epimerase